MKDALNLIKGTAVFAVQALLVFITFMTVITMCMISMHFLADLIFGVKL